MVQTVCGRLVSKSLRNVLTKEKELKLRTTYMREPLTLYVSVVVLVQHPKPERYSTLNKLQDSVPYHQSRYQLLADCPEGILETKRPADAKNGHQEHRQSGQSIPGNPPDLAERNPTKRSWSSVR